MIATAVSDVGGKAMTRTISLPDLTDRDNYFAIPLTPVSPSQTGVEVTVNERHTSLAPFARAGRPL